MFKIAIVCVAVKYITYILSSLGKSRIRLKMLISRGFAPTRFRHCFVTIIAGPASTKKKKTVERNPIVCVSVFPSAYCIDCFRFRQTKTQFR